MSHRDVHVRHVVAAGFHTRYLEAGRKHSSNGTILLVHDGAYGGSAEVSWSEVLPALAAHYHVVAPDLLGYGGTDKVVFLDRSPYESRISHLAGFCALLGLRAVHAVGSSFGGSVLLRAAAGKSGQLPLVSVTSLAGTGGPWRRADGAAALSSYDGTEADIERIVRLMTDDYPGQPAQVHARYLNTLLPGHVEACDAPRLRNPALPSQRSFDEWPAQLSHCVTPLLLVTGRRDDLLEPRWTDHFERLPCVSTVELDCRHAPNLDRPQQVVEVLTEFIGSVASRRETATS